ncbi:MAG TPA: diaminopimelate epimerase [Crocinitomicaceae bacterium]|nr:diaminopimelate epimerase [Crocinitomicaceae bacterium]
MKIKFSKYQGTGNDFVMLDNMTGCYDNLTIAQIQFLCDRKLGVGADGLIKLSTCEAYDFEVEYFNADGTQSFCGNGARCSVAFANSLGLIQNSETFFLAIDGEHKASINDGVVRLEMLPVKSFIKNNNDFVLDTGSPHYVHFSDEVKEDIVSYGKGIRYSDEFSEKGINVNIVSIIDRSIINVRTYERGVEDETLSCGTGVTACALVYILQNPELTKVDIETKGGKLIVEANPYSEENGFRNIWLSGPVKKVFDGSIDI